MAAPDRVPDGRCPASFSCEGILPAGHGRISVLYVDDESCLLDVAKIFLESKGPFTVSTSDSGTSALGIMEKEHFDAIVADYQMPGMDGIELLRKIRSVDREIPFILFTGKGREEIAIEAISNGADFYIQKGGNATAQFADLARKITFLVERIRYRKSLAETTRKYTALLESDSDAIMVARVDAETVTIAEANAYAFSLFGLERAGYTAGEAGYCLPDLWPDGDTGGGTLREYILRYAGTGTGVSSWTFRRTDGAEVSCELSLRKIVSGNSVRMVLVVARDMTGQRQEFDALSRANRRLSLLSAITRHDVRNRLMVLEAYLTLVKSNPADPAAADYFQKMTDLARGIRKQIEFTREYQELGNSAPQWQDVRDVVECAARQPDAGGLRIEAAACAGIEIYADRMLEKVFCNLIQNAILHGGHVSEIAVSAGRDGGGGAGCAIIVQDNGVGVPQEKKERIFEPGFGRNSGLGLYLVREILGITGITIRETGTPGNGARFEILVPSPVFRTSRRPAGKP